MLLPYLWESTAAFSYSTTEVDGDLFKNVSEKKHKRRKMAQYSSFCYFCDLFNA